MNRRTALLLTTLMGAFLPPNLLGQETRRRSSKARTRQDRGFQPASSSSSLTIEPTQDEFEDEEPVGEDPPSGFRNEAGFQWMRRSISRYTRAAQSQKNPQKAIIDWIFRRTGPNAWHGEKTAVLNASKTELWAYNSPEILDQVDEVVERFTGAKEDVLSLHVQFIAAVDTRWRHSVFSRLQSVGSGPQGQQIWMMRVEDAALVLSQMQIQQGFRKLTDQRIDMVNGQTLTIKTSEPRTFSGGIQRESAAGTGFQPKADKLEESIIMRLSPLLAFEQDEVDAAIELTVNSVQSFQRTKIIAPREVGPSEMAIDVPVSYQTHLDQTVKNWPLGQTLLISGGIHPGIIDKKGGWLGTPLGAPSSTEVLVFLDAETITRSRRRSRNSDVAAARPADEEEPAPEEEEDYEEPAPRPRARKTTRRATRGPDLDADQGDY
jgi:hypothetical protein